MYLTVFRIELILGQKASSRDRYLFNCPGIARCRIQDISSPCSFFILSIPIVFTFTMKYALALSALAVSTFASTIPINVHEQSQQRDADPQPFSSFKESTLGDSNVWNGVTPAVSRRDLRQKTWNPPANLLPGLNQVWEHQMTTQGSDPVGFKNFGYDQVFAGKGKINYCVRWEGDRPVTAAERSRIEQQLRKQFNKWIAILAGYDGWPYSYVDVRVVGWAVNDKSLLLGDTTGIDVYTEKDSGGAPQCPESCGRFFHQDNNYSGCQKGAARHYGKSSSETHIKFNTDSHD